MKNTFALKYWSEKIQLKKSAGQIDRLASLLAQSTIDLNPHQIQAAIYAFNSPLSRGSIMADEVGLGKTIEAGLVISQLVLEERNNILIIVPASLRTQWQEELNIHFGLESIVLDSKSHNEIVTSTGVSPLTKPGIYITSLHFAYRFHELVGRQPWDLVVIDEAHRLRNVYQGKKSKIAFTLRTAIQDKPKLLLTATPLQNNLLELYGLASFIDDKLLGNQYFFKSRFIKKLTDNPTLQNETLLQLRKIIVGSPDDEEQTGILNRTLRRQVKEYVPFTERHSVTYDFTPSQKEQELYNVVSEYLQRPRTAAIATAQRSLMVLIYRKLLASSSYAIAPTLKKLYERLENELVRRNNKQELNEYDQPDLFKDLSDDEDLSELEDRERVEPKGLVVPDDYTDEEIRAEINELKEYYQLAKSIIDNTKAQELVTVAKKLLTDAKTKGWPQKIVVFTESTRTQEYLHKILEEAGVGTTLFNGSNNSKSATKAYEKWTSDFPVLAQELSKNIATRQALVHEFKNNPDKQIFLTTEAGSEGLNLQHANLLINYDLPWNPQRVEQRIGRVHRYGQKYEVIIANLLNTANHADKRVLELLRDKLGIFDGLFGSSDEILGNLEDGIDFEHKILEIYQTCKSPEEIDAAFQSMQAELKHDIDSTMHKIRENMLNHFDDSITTLFRKTDTSIKDTLTEYDHNLSQLIKYYYRDFCEIDPNDPGKITIEGTTYLVREEREEEKGVLPRLHNTHPFIKEILSASSNIVTNPIPTVKLSRGTGKTAERLVNIHEGFIFVYKLIISAVEEEEILIPLAFSKVDNKYQPLDPELSKHLAETSSHITDESLSQSPISQTELLSVWDKWKQPIVARYEKRNQHLYSRETDRIYRYWDNHSIQTKESITKSKKEIEELRRKRESTLDFHEKRRIDQRIQSRDLTLQKYNIALAQEETEALIQKEIELKELNTKLELNQSEELIAICRFKLIP